MVNIQHTMRYFHEHGQFMMVSLYHFTFYLTFFFLKNFFGLFLVFNNFFYYQVNLTLNSNCHVVKYLHFYLIITEIVVFRLPFLFTRYIIYKSNDLIPMCIIFCKSFELIKFIFIFLFFLVGEYREGKGKSQPSLHMGGMFV